MTSLASRNKARGRAFQTKLAEMVQGMNVGTLGGEDVMHHEFSYEAKTYNKKAKSYGGKDWMGEVWLTEIDYGLASNGFSIVRVNGDFPNLIMMRWPWWKQLIEGGIPKDKFNANYYNVARSKFIGNSYMDQAEKNCPDSKLPVVVVHTTGRRHDQDIVLVRELYFKSLLEKLY